MILLMLAKFKLKVIVQEGFTKHFDVSTTLATIIFSTSEVIPTGPYFRVLSLLHVITSTLLRHLYYGLKVTEND